MKQTKSQKGAFKDFLFLLAAVGALLLLAVLVLRLFGIQPTSEKPQKIEYIIVVRGEEDGTHDYIHEGDRVIDRTNRRLLGTVESISFSNHTEEVYHESEGRLVMRRIPGKEDVRIVIAADTTAPYTVAGKTIAIGTPLTFRTRDFAGSGTVVEIRS